jgi:uncharacterized protein (DUF486 family)
MTKGFLTVVLLLISNVFMTFAWYGHLKFQEWGWMKKSVLWSVILISWGFALFEYIFQFLPIELVLRKMAAFFFVSIKNYSRGNYAYGIYCFCHSIF